MSAASSATHYARFSDGASAAATDAKVTLGLTGVEIVLEPSQKHHLWLYETLAAAEPLRTHAIDVLLTSHAMPGASLFVPSPEFARALRHAAPALTARAERLRHARPWLIGGLILAALIAAIYATGWSPAQTIARNLPQAWRERLGDHAIASMTTDHRRCVASDGREALDALTARLSKVSGIDEPFTVEVYDWGIVNAFAVPGGKIVMTRALIEEARGPDEVAGVLAHEMGHGIELHPETGIVRAIGLSAAVELMLGGSGGSLANLGLVLAQLGYTRAAEHEADMQALRLLKASAISSEGLGDFFRRVEKQESDDGDNEKHEKQGKTKPFRPFDLLRSHPPTAERERLVRRQPPYPSTPALDARSWDNLKAICSQTEIPERPNAESPSDGDE